MWALGFFINFVFSFLAALGLNLQKRSLTLNKTTGIPPFRQKLWLTGFALVVSGSCLDFVAFALAPMSLLAPLAALTLVWNIWIAQRVQGEKLDRSNIIATGIIGVGVVIAVVFSSHETPLYTASRLMELFFAPFAIAYMVITILVMMGAAYSLRRLQHTHGVGKALSYGLLAGAMGGQSVMFAKATVELLKAALVGEPIMMTPTPYVVGILTVALLLTQLSILNRGMAEYDALVLIPVYQAWWILCSTLSGLIYFAEWSTLSSAQQFFFVVGTLITIGGIGVLLFARRNMFSSAASGAVELTDMDVASPRDGGISDAAGGKRPGSGSSSSSSSPTSHGLTSLGKPDRYARLGKVERSIPQDDYDGLDLFASDVDTIPARDPRAVATATSAASALSSATAATTNGRASRSPGLRPATAATSTTSTSRGTSSSPAHRPSAERDAFDDPFGDSDLGAGRGAGGFNLSASHDSTSRPSTTIAAARRVGSMGNSSRWPQSFDDEPMV